MEPIEINAGAYYLRGLRADQQIDDRPALASLGIDDPNHVSAATAAWLASTEYTWAVCAATDPTLLAEVVLRADGSVTGWGHDEGALDAGLTAAGAFGSAGNLPTVG